MKINPLYKVVALTLNEFDSIIPMFEHFREVAKDEYGFPRDAIDIPTLRLVLDKKILSAYMLKELPEDRWCGFMLYAFEPFGALEIKVLYLTEGVPHKVGLEQFMNQLIEDCRSTEGWEVMSFALLGSKQAQYIRYLTWAGLIPVGQAVVKFHFYDGITLEIFQRITLEPLPKGYRFVTYEPRYEEGVVDVLADAFEKSVDALWDPRFRSRDGVKQAFAFVRSGGYGMFYPDCTSVLLNEQNTVVGVCLLNLVSAEEANIPLVGLAKSERRKKLGKTLLANTLNLAMSEVLKGKLAITQVSATVATDNLPAVRMYRHTGFQEDHWYTHVYQQRESVMARRAGQWC